MLKIYNITPILFFICFTASLFATIDVQGQQKFVFHQPKMGSPFIITIYGGDSIKVRHAVETAFRKVDTLNEIFSDYLDSSELNRLSRTSGSGRYIPVSHELFTILKLSVRASHLSKGSFDITVGPVVKIWRKARREKKFPDTDSIKKALLAVNYHYIHLDTVHQSVWLGKPHMQLDLGGIAKGYAAQEALNVIMQKGFSSAMVNAGGDIALGDPPPGRAGWRIGISIPESKSGLMQKMLLLKNKAVATSGDVYQYFEWKGKRYSHIINPKTGYGVTHLRNVTVIADDGATADWLASACSILTIHKALQLVKKFPDAALFIAEKRGDKIYKISSANFNLYLKQ